MPNYQLEIKQRESYPRCRVNLGFFQSLLANRDIHTNGCPGLFLYAALCSCVSPRKNRIQFTETSFAIDPGEWVCPINELMDVLRLSKRRQLLDALWVMQNRSLLQYTLLDRGNIIKYKINGWKHTNHVLASDCPNQYEISFFFLPAATAAELVSSVKCSEMDILLDLWFSAVYQDGRVKGSYSSPLFFFRSDDPSAMVTYDMLSRRWGLSKAKVQHILQKLENLGYIALHGSAGRPEMMIYLADRLSAIFHVSDIMLDKDDLPMTMWIDFSLTANNLPGLGDIAAQKVWNLLSLQGVSCGSCRQCTHKLYPLPENTKNQEGQIGFRMEIMCGWNTPLYTFDLFLLPEKN